jgi:predicted DNA-binding protein with PD1-like motif
MTELMRIEYSDTIIGRLSYGHDLLEEITSICVDRKILMGKIEALGAVQKSCLGFYKQDSKQYQFLNFDKPSEILNLKGNISIKDGKPFVHAHIILADESGNAYGGHLAPGTITYACEFIIHRFSGAGLKRGMDDETGLPLWKII